MNSAGHLIVSIVKSSIRIGSCITAFWDGNIKILALGFGVAEILGIVEELVDARD